MIKINNLSYRYSKNKVLFNGLDLEIPPGKIYGLLGKNGAGKSTLMKTITGLLFPTTGTCTVNGLPSNKRDSSFLKLLFFIPEECYLPGLSINKFIDIYAPFYPKFDLDEFNNYLIEFSIDKNEHLSKLSYGQKKKTFIAFGLACNTQLLVMDEPTNGLDIPSKVQFRKIITQVKKDNKTILISTHQVRDLDDLISSVIIIDNNKILLHKEKDSIGRNLIFYNKNTKSVNNKSFYEEETANGCIAIAANDSEQTNAYIDLEVLFNATLSNPTLINSFF